MNDATINNFCQELANHRLQYSTKDEKALHIAGCILSRGGSQQQKYFEKHCYGSEHLQN
jgi:hypothetical protein